MESSFNVRFQKFASDVGALPAVSPAKAGGNLARLFMDRGKTVTECKPGGKPFRPRSIGRYLVGRHPIRSNGGGSHGPGLSVTSTSPCPQPPGLASRSRSPQGESRGDTKAGAPKRTPCQRAERFGLTPVTGCLIIQDTPTCRPETVKEIAGGFVRLGARRYCAGLRSGPALPVRNSMNNPG